MVFNDTTNKQGLVQDTWFHIFGDSLDHSAEYPVADIARNMNEELYQVGILHWKHSPKWSFMDANESKLNIATTDLVNGQMDYSLDTDIIHIERAAIKDKDGNWRDLYFIAWSDIPYNPEEWAGDPGLPAKYSFRGNSLFLFPAPSSNDVTQSDGLKIYLSKLSNEGKFVASDTTKTPGFNPAFHRILSLKAAMDYLLGNDMDKYNAVKQAHLELKASFISWLQERQGTNRRNVLIPRKENYQ
jgi:hypothetical protein